MANIRLMYQNLFDDLANTLTVNSEATGFEKENLRHIWKTRRWRATGDTSEWIKLQVPDDLLNSGFEDWTADVPDEWYEAIAGSSIVTENQVENRSGTSCCELQVDGSNNVAQVHQDGILLLPFMKYKLVLWYKMSEAGKTAQFRVYTKGGDYYLNDDMEWQDSSYNHPLANSTSYTSETLYFYPHPDYTEYVVLVQRASAASSSIYLDDFNLHIAVNTVIVENHNLQAGATASFQSNWLDSWGSPGVDEEILTVPNKPLIYFHSSDIYNEWFRILLEDSTNPDTYIAAGRIFLGQYFEPTRGHLQPVTKQFIDPSIKRYSTGGQVSINQKEKYLQVNYNFGSIHNDDLPYFENMRNVVGQSLPYFVCETPTPDPYKTTYYLLNLGDWVISKTFHKSELIIGAEEMR